MPTFVVIAHEYPRQFARLVERLSPYPVIVHINARFDQQPFEDAVAHLDNVTFLPTAERVKINWAGYSLVRALQALIKHAVVRTQPHDHIVVLSGSDYPLRPVEDFAAFLRDSPFRQHIRYFDVALSDDHYRRSTSRRHYRDLYIFPRASRGSILSKINEAYRRTASQIMRWHRPEPLPGGLSPMRGSLWVALTAECFDDIMKLTTPRVERCLKRVFCPDEMYFHTMIAATRHASDNAAGGVEPYPGRPPSLITNFHLIDDSLDKFFTIDDLEVIESSDRWFLRKVRPPSGDTLLDWLDARSSEPSDGPSARSLAGPNPAKDDVCAGQA